MQATKENAKKAIHSLEKISSGGGFIMEFLKAAELKLPTQKNTDRNNRRKRK